METSTMSDKGQNILPVFCEILSKANLCKGSKSRIQTVTTFPVNDAGIYYNIAVACRRPRHTPGSIMLEQYKIRKTVPAPKKLAVQTKIVRYLP